MSTERPRLIAIDVETTGLNPRNDQLLEVGAVALGVDLETTGEWAQVFPSFRPWEEFVESLDPFIVEMHDKSGLLRDLKGKREPGTLSSASKSLRGFIIRHYGEAKPYLVGRNPSFDRAWLETWLPDVAQRLHYRSYDVTVLSDLGAQNPDLGAPKPGRAHRALEDASEAAEIIRWWSEWASVSRA